jgi:hypothetical protein
MGKREADPKFLEFRGSFEIDWTAIESKIAAEWEAERARPGAKPFS